MVDEVGCVADEILEMSVGTILERSRSKYTALVQTVQETVGDPDAVRLIKPDHPRVLGSGTSRGSSVYLVDQRVATVAVKLGLGLTLRGVLVQVRDGCVTGV